MGFRAIFHSTAFCSRRFCRMMAVGEGLTTAPNFMERSLQRKSQEAL
jgi:hypothetical protein